MSSEYAIRARIAVLFFTVLALAVYALNSVHGHFVVVLQYRARADYITPDINFQWLQNNILSTEITIAFTTGEAIIPIDLRHYNILYHGNIAQAAYLSVLLLLVIMVAVGVLMFDLYQTKQFLAEEVRTRGQMAAGDSMAEYNNPPDAASIHKAPTPQGKGLEGSIVTRKPALSNDTFGVEELIPRLGEAHEVYDAEREAQLCAEKAEDNARAVFQNFKDALLQLNGLHNISLEMRYLLWDLDVSLKERTVRHFGELYKTELSKAIEAMQKYADTKHQASRYRPI